MGQKLCTGSSDTPLVTFDCTIVNVTRSPNANVDVTDSPLSGDEEESESKILSIAGVVAYYGDDVDRQRAKTNERRRRGRRRNFNSQ
jgi:hypothetical protein